MSVFRQGVSQKDNDIIIEEYALLSQRISWKAKSLAGHSALDASNGDALEQTKS